MTVRAIQEEFTQRLAKHYAAQEIEALFLHSSMHILALRAAAVALHLEQQLTEHQVQQYAHTLKALEQHKPLQYILNEAYFYGLKFILNDAVLIPRPETEELVHWIIQDFKTTYTDLKILDIGTGSGCIPISLKKHLPLAKLYAFDISEEAIHTANINAQAHQLEIDFIQQDILNTSYDQHIFDIIVSNPPYIRDLERKDMDENVLKYEPALALFVPDENPLIFYEAIANYALKQLKIGGSLYVEINTYLPTETLELFKNKGFTHAELKQDMSGNARMIKCIR